MHLRVSHICHLSAACAFVGRGKKYKGFVRLILQGFVQRIAHGFVCKNVQGFVLCARPRSKAGTCTTSVINSVRQLPFCHHPYLLWPSIYQLLIINYSQTTPGVCPYLEFIFVHQNTRSTAHEMLIPKM